MDATPPDSLEAIIAEVRRAVPAGYSRADWQLAIDTLLDRHRARVLEQLRSRLVPVPMARPAEPPAEERSEEEAVTLLNLQLAIEDLLRR